MIRRILLATDFSAGSARQAEVALEYARRFGADLHALHVAAPGEPEGDGLASLRALFPPGTPVEAVVVAGGAAREIVLYAERQGIDLIVMGTRGQSGYTPRMMGSVAEFVVRNARCQVVVVPDPSAKSAPLDEHTCLLCGHPTPEQICPACRTRIRGEALGRTLDAGRSGRGPVTPRPPRTRR
jgi:nucleotide-binding universal stress UspA family protein